jgi:hypothetical protein
MNKIIGLILTIIYIIIFTNNENWFPEFLQIQNLIHESNSTYISPKAIDGILVCYLTAAFSVYFIMFTSHAMSNLSPKNSTSNSSVLKETAWIIIGYFLVGITFGILSIYKYSF